MAVNQWNVDREYLIGIRHELHQYPELCYENPETLRIIRRELDAMGIPYTEKYGKGGIVATLNAGKGAVTIGLRADTDGLLMQEENDIPYKSRLDGQMHACGHDVHTAVLLATAKALAGKQDQINCCVKFIFQTAEEGPDTGARYMVVDGVMDDIDAILSLHVNNLYPAGCIGICEGLAMPLCHPFKIILNGATGHITTPHQAIDAVAMAARVYNSIQIMISTEIDPLEQFVCGIGTIDAGQSFGSVGGHAEMTGVITTFSTELDEYLTKRIRTIAKNAAEEVGGTGILEEEVTCLIVHNDEELCKKLRKSAAKVIGEANCLETERILGCEDFSFFQSKKPGVQFWLGTGNEEKGCTQGLHSSTLTLDEEQFEVGANVFVQFVQDYMGGLQ